DKATGFSQGKNEKTWLQGCRRITSLKALTSQDWFKIKLVVVQIESLAIGSGERFLASARNDNKIKGSVLSNPSTSFRVNSVRDLSLTEPLPSSFQTKLPYSDSTAGSCLKKPANPCPAK